MPSSTETLKDPLARYRQIKLSVVGRKSGKTISIPVWFVLEGKERYEPSFQCIGREPSVWTTSY